MTRTRFETSDGNTYPEDDTYGPINPMWVNCPIFEIKQDPSIAHVYFEDFHTLALADFTITTVETGTATEALTDEICGVLLITNGTADNDTDNFQVVGEDFLLSQRQPLWFEARLKVNNATEAQLWVGLAITDTELAGGVNDSVHFMTADGTADVHYHCEGGSDTTADTGVNVVADTYNRFGIYWDGETTVEFWIDGELVGASSTNLPSAVVDTGELRVSFQLTNRVAATAKTMSVDYIKCVQLIQRAALVP